MLIFFIFLCDFSSFLPWIFFKLCRLVGIVSRNILMQNKCRVVPMSVSPNLMFLTLNKHFSIEFFGKKQQLRRYNFWLELCCTNFQKYSLIKKTQDICDWLIFCHMFISLTINSLVFLCFSLTKGQCSKR